MKKRFFLILTLAVVLLLAGKAMAMATTADDSHTHWAWCNAPGVCAECGQAVENITDIRHDRQWQNNLDYEHIMVCTRCGLQDFDTLGEHHAKCDNPTKCTVCGYEGTGFYKGNVGHYWQENFDADYHWDVCEKCGQTRGKGKHYSYCDSSNPQVCAECSQMSGNIEIRHDYGYTQQYDAEYHWSIAICLKCGTIKETGNKFPHERQCNDNTCLDCGAPYTGDQVQHSYSYSSEELKSGPEGHWYSCTLCGERDVKSHSFQSGVCTYCGYQQQESDPTPEHTTHWAYCNDITHCAECGKSDTEVTVSSIRHSITMQYTADDHWEVCSLCDYVGTKEMHSASCGNPSTCQRCGQSQGINIHNLVHPDGQWKRMTDETYHWWVCGVCGEERDREQHYQYCYDHGECYECGAEYHGTPNHDIADGEGGPYEWFADFHWQRCYRCSDQVNLEKHRSSCTAPDVCLVCGAEYADIENVTHAPGAEYFSDGESHWHVCADCKEKVEAAPHAFGPDGACTVCGYRSTATDAPTDVPTEAPTETPTDVPTAAPTDAPTEAPDDGHAHWAWCDAPNVCAQCGRTVENITDVRHEWQWRVYEEYNCHGRICARCGYRDENSIVGHYVMCDSSNFKKCSVCGYEGTKELYVEHHDKVLYDAQSHWTVCEVCGEMSSKEGHSTRCYHGTACETCGYVGDSVEIIHDYNGMYFCDPEDYVYDEAYHWAWNYCTWCHDVPKKSLYQEHSRYCNENTCRICGAPYTGSQIRHNFSSEYVGDAEGHWHVCPDCGEKSEISEHRFQFDGSCIYCHYNQNANPAPTPTPDPNHRHWAYCDDETHCAVCGKANTEVKIESVEHEIVIAYDADYHWYRCRRCEEVEYWKSTHYANCSNPTFCLVCKQSQVNISQVYHDYDESAYHYVDAEYHVYICPGCGEETRERHTQYCTHGSGWQFDEEGICQFCGGPYHGEITHLELDDKYESFGAYHWENCMACMKQVNLEKHRSSCAAPDICLVCGAEYAGIENIEHVPGKAYFSDATNHWHICETCREKADVAAHDFNASGKCKVCGYQSTGVTPTNPPTDTPTDAPTNPPTGVPTNPPTGTPTDKPTNAPTNPPTGKPTDAPVVTPTPALHEHTWVESGNPVQPSCSNSGTRFYRCSQCGETKKEEIQALGHDFSFPISSKDGTHRLYCRRCGNWKSDPCAMEAETVFGISCNVCGVCGYTAVPTFAGIELPEAAVANASAFTAAGEAAPVLVYDLTPFLPEGSGLALCLQVAPQNGVLLIGSVKIAVPCDLDTLALRLVFLADGEAPVEVPFEVIDGMLTFTAADPGIFALVPVQD